MKGRCTRSGKKRKDFKIDEMKAKDKESLQTNENLIIAFVRFDDEKISAKNARVETKLEKISHKRRKEGRDFTLPKRIGEAIFVVVNTDNNGTEQLPAVCVAKSEFDSNAGENLNTTSYQLTFDIEPIPTRNPNDEPPNKQTCTRKSYHAELPVFDKSGRNLLLNGLYEVRSIFSELRNVYVVSAKISLQCT